MKNLKELIAKKSRAESLHCANVFCQKKLKKRALLAFRKTITHRVRAGTGSLLSSSSRVSPIEFPSSRAEFQGPIRTSWCNNVIAQ